MTVRRVLRPNIFPLNFITIFFFSLPGLHFAGLSVILYFEYLI